MNLFNDVFNQKLFVVGLNLTAICLNIVSCLSVS